MDWNRLSPFVETPLRACLAIVAVNAALILVSEPVFQVFGSVSSGWAADRQLASAFFLFLLYVAGSIGVWHLFGRLLRGRFTILQRLSTAAVGVLPIIAAAWLAEARAEGTMCGILGAYVTGVRRRDGLSHGYDRQRHRPPLRPGLRRPAIPHSLRLIHPAP